MTNQYKIGDKVVFKKEVLDKISKIQFAKSLVGCSLREEYYNYLINNDSNFKRFGYFEVRGFGSNKNNLGIGIYLGKDLFEHYQEECSYKESDLTTTKNYQNNEIKFQKPKAAFSRGSIPKGNPICGRKHKTAIVVGRLSNQEISC